MRDPPPSYARSQTDENSSPRPPRSPAISQTYQDKYTMADSKVSDGVPIVPRDNPKAIAQTPEDEQNGPVEGA
jgi:hypothetical protein